MKALITLVCCLFTLFAISQNVIKIGLVNDHAPDSAIEDSFETAIESEILQLLQNRHTIVFTHYHGNGRLERTRLELDKAYAENDIIVTIGTGSSISALNRSEYVKPTIVSIVLDPELQGVTITEEGSSGIDNFAFLESPFDIKRDLDILFTLSPFERLLVISEEGSIGDEALIKELFSNYVEEQDISISTAYYKDDLTSKLSSDTVGRTAAYLLPYLGQNGQTVSETLRQLNDNLIPSTALLGDNYIRAGALVAYKTSDNMRKIPRRIALNIMKIVEGQNAKDLPVTMETFDDNLIINMETARRINIYPDFDLMSEATLYNLEIIPTDNKLTLETAIAYALANNLDIKINEANVNLIDTDIDIAKSEMLPSLDVSTSYSIQDEVSTLSKQGALGRSNLLASGELSQIILAEPVLANIAIQKMLKVNQEESLRQTQMDIIIEVAQAYMNILFAKSNLNIQQENVARTRENYDISKAKESIGYIGSSDINRWEAELANANSDLNSGYATLRQAKFQLNQLLNRPINEVVEIADLDLESSSLFITDARTDYIDNYGKLGRFADFLVAYAKNNLPELAQINIATDVEKRLQLSRKRALYLPNIAVSGTANRVLGRYDIPTGLSPTENSTTWNIGLGMSYPIFQGNYRKKLIEQSNLNLSQLQDSKKDLENRLELRIRSQLETVGAAFSRMELSNAASEASTKNFAIVQDAYSAGQSNVTTLIDAQNNALFSKLSATNAVYSFILDFLTLERSVGVYNFLATEEENNAFFEEARKYLFAK